MHIDVKSKVLCAFPGWGQDADAVIAIVGLPHLDGINHDLVEVVSPLAAPLLRITGVTFLVGEATASTPATVFVIPIAAAAGSLLTITPTTITSGVPVVAPALWLIPTATVASGITATVFTALSCFTIFGHYFAFRTAV
jgi:hypothetical protein